MTTERSAIYAAIMDQIQALAETAPSNSACLRLIDLLGVVHDARTAEEVEAAYGEMTH